jgi:DNA-binding NarL/FixJ family response regulator
MQPTQVAIVDSNDLSRHGIRSLVEKASPIVKVVGVFENVRALESCLHERQVDVLLLDDLLPAAISIETVLRDLRALDSSLQVIVLSLNLNVSYIQNVLKQGAQGYVYKEDRLEANLIYGIELVRRGVLYLSPHVAALPYTGAAQQRSGRLNSRDLGVLQLMRNGKNVQEMALALGVKDRAIYHSQHKLRDALGVRTTELIVAAAAKKGLIPDIET